jgi:transposase
MPTRPKHIIKLTEQERVFLKDQTKSGDWTPRQVTRAKILLLSDIDGPALQDKDISKAVNCSLATVCNRRRQFAKTGSVEDTIFDKPRSGRPRIIDGEIDAHMTAIACSTPPEGRTKWTLRLIRDRIISLKIVDGISHTTIAEGLKKKKLSHG